MLDLWIEVYPRVWFWSNRGSFVTAEHMARAGSLHGDIHEYYGARLPGGLAGISVDGNIGTTTSWTDDGELVDVSSGLVLDGFADDMCPNYALADGWWWADGVSCDVINR